MAETRTQYEKIPLYGRRGQILAYALVDATDVEWLSQWQWHFLHSGTGYAGRTIKVDGAIQHVLMHREILGLPHASKGMVTDHINHNTLDNRRNNLRAVTQAQNLQNKVVYRNSTSHYRGVHWENAKHKWRALARLDGHNRHIGYFRTEEEAAAAASQWRAENMPFAVETIQ